MRRDIESCGYMEKIKTRLYVDGLVASVKGKLEALKRHTACGREA